MAKILFRLRQVPDDEADDVRRLLDQNSIDWYETSAGKFQISFPAIWVRDDSDETRARKLIEDYQRKRSLEIRTQFEEQKASGEAETIFTRMIANPLPVLLTLLFVAFILYVSIKPFVSLVT